MASGCDHIIHACQAKADMILGRSNSEVILQVDCRNAFNSIRRRVIIDKIINSRALHPIATFFDWAYGGPTPLYSYQGKYICSSSTGVRQGDPLGSLYFCLRIQDILSDIQERYGIALLAFADDITLLGGAYAVSAAYIDLVRLLGGIGLVVNSQKSKIFSHRELDESLLANGFLAHGIPKAYDGIVVLGAPVGNLEYIVSKSGETVDRCTKVIPLVLQLSTKVAFQLLRWCISARAGYLIRTALPWGINNATQLFDERIDKAIGSILSLDDQALDKPSSIERLDACPGLDDLGGKIRALPYTFGGLSIRRSSEVKDVAWFSSFTKSMKWISSNLPDLFNTMAPTILTEQHIVAFRDITIAELDNAPIQNINDLCNYFSRATQLLSQKELTVSFVDKPNYKILTASLVNQPRLQAWHLSECNKVSYLWLSDCSSSNPLVSLSNAAFASNLGLRLLQPLFRRSPLLRATCPCKAIRLPRDEVQYHVFSCGAASIDMMSGPAAVRTRRHNGIRDALAEFLGKICPSAQLQKEPVLPGIEGLGVKRSDVALSLDGAMIHFDIVVTNPSSKSSIDGVRSHLHPLAAAKKAEDNKMQMYNRHFRGEAGHMHPIARQLVPFALEVTGAFGPRATSAIETLAGLKEAFPVLSEYVGSSRRWFLRKVSTICARSRHQMISYARSQFVFDRAMDVDMDPPPTGNEANYNYEDGLNFGGPDLLGLVRVPL
jgi:hypothetical protein